MGLSPRRQLGQAIRSSLNGSKDLLKTSFFALFAIWLGSFFLNQLAHEMMADAINQGPNIPAIILLALTEMTVSFLLLLLIPRRLWELRQKAPLSSLGQNLSQYSKDLAAELMRVAAGVLVGVVMGVVPGLLRAIRWTFVPHVVLLDKQYEAGERDALNQSTLLTKGLGWWLALLWLAFTLIDLGLYNVEIFSEYLTPADWPTWPLAALVSVISFAFMIYSHLLYFALYVIRLELKGDTQ